MKKQPIWEKCHIKCPEQKGKAELFLEWSIEDDRKILRSASCKNEKLLDLSGQDCEWTCWEEISEKTVKNG